jgi:DNA-binding beta-propeller fold protein YncE
LVTVLVVLGTIVVPSFPSAVLPSHSPSVGVRAPAAPGPHVSIGSLGHVPQDAVGVGRLPPASRDAAGSNATLGSVAFSWVLANGTVNSGAVNQPYFVGPDQLLYVAANQTLWTAFASPPTGGVENVTLLNVSSGTTSILTGVGNVTGWVLDGARDAVYLTEVAPGQSNGELVPVSTHHPDILRAPTPVGPSPAGVGLDPTTGEVWVLGPKSASLPGNVTVVSATNGSIRATLPVGVDPTGVAFDAALGRAFVANSRSDNLTVINSSTGAVVGAAISLPGRPVPGAVEFDAAIGKVLLLETPGGSAPSHLLLVDPSNGSVVGDFAVPSAQNATALALDSATGNAFVTTGTGALLVWYPANASWRALVNVGGRPCVEAYGSSSGVDYIGRADQVFVSSVDTRSPTSSARTISFGAGPRQGVYDAVDGRVYVANSFDAGPGNGTGPDQLAAINVTTGAPDLAVSPAGPLSSPVGAGLVGVAADPSSGRLFVADRGWNSSSVLSEAGGAYLAAIALPFAPVSVADDGVRGIVYFSSATGHVVGFYASNLTESQRWNLTAPVTPWPGPVEGLAVDPSSGTVIDLVPDTAGSTASTVWLLTPSNGSARATSPIPGFLATAVAWDPQNGAAYVSGPTGALDVVNLTNATVIGGPNLGGTPSYLAFDPGRATIDVAESSGDRLAIVNASNHSIPLTGIPTVPTGPGPDGIVVVPGTDEVVVSNYGSGTVDAYSALPEVGALTPHLAIPTVGEVATVLLEGEVGTPVFFDALAGGGVSPLSFVFSGLPAGCPSSDVGHLFCVPAVPGWANVSVVVTDALGRSAMASTSLLIAPTATAGLYATPTAVDGVGSVVTLVATVTGGVAVFRFAMEFGDTLVPPLLGSLAGRTLSLPHPYEATGVFRATVLIVDSLGVRSTSSTLVSVGSPLAGNLTVRTPNGSSHLLGDPVVFQLQFTGGVSPFNLSWAGSDGTRIWTGWEFANEAAPQHVFPSPGIWSVRVWVNDSARGVLALFANVTVVERPVTGGVPPLDLAGGAAIAAVAIAVVAIYFVRRRKRTVPTPAV